MFEISIILMLLEYVPFFIVFLTAVLFARWIYKDIKNTRYAKNFTQYVGILEYFMEKAYEMVYKDRILIFSMEATKPSEKDLDVIVQDFVRLVQKFLGPTFQKELINMYGNRETFIRNIVEYFNTKFEGDKIREASLENIANTE
jgi:hypothetical protein